MAPDIALLLAAVVSVLVASLAVGPAVGTLVALGVVLVLGVPHGALDGELVRPLLRPRLGRSWIGVFAVPYLALAALVLACWRIAPELTLMVFLAGSVLHFGAEDAGRVGLAAAARGGIPVAVPVLLHGSATAVFLGGVSLTPMQHLPLWLDMACWAWCAVALLWCVSAVKARDRAGLGDAALVCAVFAVLPPLQAFATYFVCLHAPRHVRALIASGRAPRVHSLREAAWRSLPWSLLTLLIGAGLWRWFPGKPPDRLLALTIQGLSALTLPHMLLDLLLSGGLMIGDGKASSSFLKKKPKNFCLRRVCRVEKLCFARPRQRRQTRFASFSRQEGFVLRCKRGAGDCGTPDKVEHADDSQPKDRYARASSRPIKDVWAREE